MKWQRGNAAHAKHETNVTNAAVWIEKLGTDCANGR
jgi:hypothetical protein